MRIGKRSGITKRCNPGNWRNLGKLSVWIVWKQRMYCRPHIFVVPLLYSTGIIGSRLKTANTATKTRNVIRAFFIIKMQSSQFHLTTMETLRNHPRWLDDLRLKQQFLYLQVLRTFLYFFHNIQMDHCQRLSKLN